jgi:phosphoglycerate kinase
MTDYRTLDDVTVKAKRVLVRVDLNVPLNEDGLVSDDTRLQAIAPTVLELSDKGAKVILLAHFGRPKGKVVTSMSLKQVTDPLARVLGKPVAFASDCVGDPAQAAILSINDGDILVLENTRFHAGEEKNDRTFAESLAKLGDLYVNDAFSAAHRAHASTEGVTHFLPSYAGRSMEKELNALQKALGTPKRPVVALVGGAKVSSKIDLLNNLVSRVDAIIVGGGMANTFLAARGLNVDKSLCEHDLLDTARMIEASAKEAGCTIVLPDDVVVAENFAANAAHKTVAADQVKDGMILDAGYKAVESIKQWIDKAETLVWNGPLGAFEITPFDRATVKAAQYAAEQTQKDHLLSVAGGGDTVAALNHAGVAEKFSYVSTAGGAFLEWLEGKTLPGIAALESSKQKHVSGLDPVINTGFASGTAAE